MKKILSILLLISSVSFGQTIQPNQLAIPTGSYLIGVTSGTKSVGSATATIPVSKVTGALTNTTSITINGSTQSLSVSPSFTTTVQDCINQDPTVNGLVMQSPSGFVFMNMDDTGIQLNTNGGVFEHDGYPILTEASTNTVTNKTYLNGVNTGTTYINEIALTNTVAPTYSAGILWYNPTYKCLSVYDDISNTSIEVGQEMVVRARNNTGSTISNGQVVYISGALGQNPTIELAKADAEATSLTIGVATHNIATNTVGKITISGLVNDVNTSSFSDGDALFVSPITAGSLTNVAPTSPNFVSVVGIVAYAHPTQGKILVRTEMPVASNTVISTSNRISPTSNAVKANLDLKQNTLTAGNNITISTNTISATTPTLTVVNGTLSGSYPTQTLTIPSGSTSVVSTNSFITVSSNSITAVPNYVTPEMYGAVGNGSTNDATALQNAINSGKKVLGDLSKSYLTASTLTLTANAILENLNLKVTSNIVVISIEGNYNTLTNCSITGTTSLGHGASNYGVSIIGNSGLTSYRVGNKIQGCYFNNLNTAVYTASMVGTSSGGNHEGALTISDATIENCTTGINFNTRAEYNNISNTKIYKCTTGFSNTGGNNSFTGGQITDCSTGFDLVGGTNDGHSVASGVMLNHNTDNIKSTSLTKGYLFNGCMVYAGNVSLTSSFGVTFESCAFSTLSITCTSNTNTAFNNCKFVTTPTISTTGTAPIYFNSNFETTAPSGQVSSDNYYLTANATNTSSATPVIALSIPVVANKRYYIEGTIRVGVNNTGGIKLQVTLPTGATMFVEFMGNTSAATAFSRATVTTSASLTSVAFWTVNSNAGMIRIAGELNISSTGGNVTIDFAPNTDTQTATVYQLGTCVKSRILN